MITKSTVKPTTNAARGPMRLPQSKGLDGSGSASIVEAGFFSGISSVFGNSTGPNNLFYRTAIRGDIPSRR